MLLVNEMIAGIGKVEESGFIECTIFFFAEHVIIEYPLIALSKWLQLMMLS